MWYDLTGINERLEKYHGYPCLTFYASVTSTKIKYYGDRNGDRYFKLKQFML